MFSKVFKILLAFIGFGPALLMLYFSSIYCNRDKLSFWIDFSSTETVYEGFKNFTTVNFLLIVFIIFYALAGLLIWLARRKFPEQRIAVKQIKSADKDFITIIFSLALPLTKLIVTNVSDMQYFFFFCVAVLVYSIIMKNSYHMNLLLKLGYGYNHYEVTTTGEINYLVISKKAIKNKENLTRYVALCDHMLLDTTPNK